MLTKTTYPLNVALIRMGLTTAQEQNGGLAKPRTTQAAGFGTYRLAHTDTPVTIIYRLNDLYIDGFIPGDGIGDPFLFKSSTYARTPNKLAFDGDYRALGLNRNTAFRMNLEAVNGAVIALHNVRTLQQANGLKEYYWKLAVAFAEAVRFDDVLDNIVNDKPIDDLDWSKHKRVDKIRVLKSS